MPIADGMVGAVHGILHIADHGVGPGKCFQAERALHHWVIALRIGYGARALQGSHAFALTISVIETYRKRGVLPWPYLAEVIRLWRTRLSAPTLP